MDEFRIQSNLLIKASPEQMKATTEEISSKVKTPSGDEDAAEVEEKVSVATEAVAAAAVPNTTGDGEDNGVANKISDFRRRRLTMTLKSVERDEAQEEKERAQAETMYRSEEIGEAPLHMPLPVPDAKVGTYSFHGLEPSCFEETGVAAKINQDRGCVVYPFKDDRRQALLSVFDGHGEHGDVISHFVMHELQKCLTGHPALVEDPSRALREAYLKVDERLAEVKPLESMYSGTTAVTVLMRDQLMWIANTGDSRVVLAVSTGPSEPLAAVDLSVDQNPHSPGEQARIEAAGGFVSPPPEPGLSSRVWLDAAMTQIGLAMARSIGDRAVKSIGVVADPEVVEHSIKETDKFLILASDGVWEFVSSEEAVKIVHANLDQGTMKAAQVLIEAAAQKWRESEGDYRDDITAIIVRLPLFSDSPS